MGIEERIEVEIKKYLDRNVTKYKGMYTDTGEYIEFDEDESFYGVYDGDIENISDKIKQLFLDTI